ncbi:hypothetical protein [Sinorhizobium meliloti]|uniref:hypothetical protein n=1 Tax=Rhizobium meliloti TaxID=382 RepID=UPI000FD8B58A|nr:hypothetical protein [Sinorhizobium meliloti]RVQ21808.1 hypothetical protein CN067_11800 [Sinorhizobium meliloti]RVQ55742.1 hypothetical protein CN060_21060 [Sinorhizobium meliloti]
MTKEQQFEAFWKSYPRRVAKGAARKAFDKAIKKTTLESMLKAITEYVAKKPEKIDFKHPATWLNGECWDDEWEPAQARVQRPTYGANYGRAEIVSPPEPETPEQRARKAEMARRLRETAAAMRTVQ